VLWATNPGELWLTPEEARALQTQLGDSVEVRFEDEKERLSEAQDEDEEYPLLKETPNAEDCMVLECDDYDDLRAAYRSHSSKDTFDTEDHLVERRVFEGASLRCRTWILVPANSKVDHELDEYDALAAVTLHMNPYEKSQKRWAQVMNMSAKQEGIGYGSALICGVEELLRRENYDVLIAYPALNGKAPKFWNSMGYFERKDSLLPPEELVTSGNGGPLWPECTVARDGERRGQSLPRLEKQIQVLSAPPRNLKTPKSPAAQRKEKWKEADWRGMKTSESRLDRDALQPYIPDKAKLKAEVELKASPERRIARVEEEPPKKRRKTLDTPDTDSVKDEPKDKLKAPKLEPKDELKDEPKDEPKAEPKEEAKRSSRRILGKSGPKKEVRS